MQVHKFLPPEAWAATLQRPVFDPRRLERKVGRILNAVRKKGDKAVLKFTAKYDRARLKQLEVAAADIARAETQVSEELRGAIMQAAHNITAFHTAQLSYPRIIETMPGVNCWQKILPIEKVGLYVPGGSAPLFSTVLMLGLPAKIMGCKQVILCTPPNSDGQVHPAILFAAKVAGITKVYKTGGAQAIAAMAYGTETIPPVYKIFGPGNQFVTQAKRMVQQEGVAIDMPAGPSEVAVFSDVTAHPEFIAADLLSQAEHGPDSQVLWVTDQEDMLQTVMQELKKQLHVLPRRAIAQLALEKSHAVLVNNSDEAMALLNDYAPEHLILNCQDAESCAEKVTNAGSVFIGPYSPESVGDYASGTNHTLPTNGYARMYSGVSLASFGKTITYQQLTQAGLRNIGHHVEQMAIAESLHAHAAAVSIRLKQLNDVYE